MQNHDPRPGRQIHAVREITFSIVMLVITAIATLLLGRELWADVSTAGSFSTQIRSGIFVAIVTVLIFSNVVYLTTRLGYYVRRNDHRRMPFENLVSTRWDDAESIAVLVPSYKEDVRTIRQTLLSAAMQHYPNKRVVLLLDDPQHPRDHESAELLAAARRVPGDIERFLKEPRELVSQAILDFTGRADTGRVNPDTEVRGVLDVYERIIRWMDRGVNADRSGDHTDRQFLDLTFHEHRTLLRSRAHQLVIALSDHSMGPDEIAREYQRLLSLFDVEITVFERKRYANVSLDASKAANLNTYIGFMGKSVRESWHNDGWHLDPVRESDGANTIVIPDAAYVLTLDADSMLAPDYMMRLSSVLAEPGNEEVAVVQTPYTAIPHAPGVLERIAGATTDIQYIVHQGFTWFDATFWVGANALLRKCALEDIRIEDDQRGYTISKYIQDRTVIEDTESTVDLAVKGWSLFNYPERLAFSATPPDFGSLLIQRRRWANGGLLIVPKLVRQLFTRRFRPISLPSFFVRLHYLSSIATGSVGMLALLAMPVEPALLSIWLPVLAAAYFVTYWRDLMQHGYPVGDIIRVSAFNIMLLPVNLAGVLKSIQQAITGTPTPFGRTPKVEGRTAAPAWAVLALWGLMLWCMVSGTVHLLNQSWLQAAYSLSIGAGFLYAVLVFVGIKASWEDVTRRWRVERPAIAAHNNRPAHVGGDAP